MVLETMTGAGAFFFGSAVLLSPSDLCRSEAAPLADGAPLVSDHLKKKSLDSLTR